MSYSISLGHTRPPLLPPDLQGTDLRGRCGPTGIHAMPDDGGQPLPSGFSPDPPIAALRRCGPRSVCLCLCPWLGHPAGGIVSRF